MSDRYTETPFTRQFKKDAEALRQRIEQRHKAAPGECSYCDRERAAGNDFHPSHDASPRCESGRRSHCSCDTCF